MGLGEKGRFRGGFSLVEITVVLIIIGLMLSGMLVPLSAQLHWQKVKETKKSLEEIKDALMGFAIIKNRLPCPANENGFESLSLCHTQGFLPWAELGVGRYDGWGNLFYYVVDDKVTLSIKARVRLSKIELVRDSADDTSVYPINDRIFAPCVIWSRGQVVELRSDNERENADRDGKYIFGGADQQYDDIVEWVNWNILKYRLIMARKWPVPS